MAVESLQKRWNEWLGAFKKKDAGGDKEAKIKATNVIYVFGPPGTGKSFTGDYMDVVHGYHHVDGDIPLKHMTLVPEYKDVIEKWVDGDWVPHFNEIARLTVEAAKDHEKVVVSHATDKNEYRDHVVKKLVEGGVSEDHITLIQLTIDPRVKARGLYYRTKRQLEQAGMTIEDACKDNPNWEFEGEITEEKFIELQLADEAKSPFPFENHPDAIMVDISGRDVSHFDNVDKALGLTRSSDLTYEGVCAKVKPIDEARDKKVMESGFQEAFAEIMAIVAAKYGDNSLVIDEEGEDEKKVEEMKKRRSSLVELERCGLSFRESSKKGSMRRKSLIKTGKIDEE